MKTRLFKKNRVRVRLSFLLILIALLSVLAYGSYLFYITLSSKVPDKPAEPVKKTTQNRLIENPRVGLLTQLSGPFEKEAEMLHLGIEAAWKDSETTGAPGELTVLDAGQNATTAVQSVRKLIRDPNVVAVIVHLPVKTVSQIAPILEEEKMVMVVPASSHQQLTQHPWVLPLVCLDSEEGGYAAEVAKDWADGRAVAVVHSSSTYGKLLFEGFMKKSRQIDLTVESFASESDDLPVQGIVEKILVKQPPVIWLAGSPFWGVEIISALAEKGYAGRLLVPRSYGGMMIEDLLGEYLNQLYVLRPALVTDKNNSGLQEFTSRFRELYWREPKWIAVLGYDAMKWIAEILREGPVSRKALRDRFFQYDSPDNAFQGLAGPVFFDARHHTRRPLQVTVYRNGRFMPYDAEQDSSS